MEPRTALARAAPPAWGWGAPGAHGHLLRVVNVGTSLATVAPAEAVVVHAVLLLPPPPPLPRLPHDGQAALHGPARGRERAVSPSRPGARGPPPRGTYLARERLQLPAGSMRPVGGGAGSLQAHPPRLCPPPAHRPGHPGQGREEAKGSRQRPPWCPASGPASKRVVTGTGGGLPATSLCLEQSPATLDPSGVSECHSVLQQLRTACLKHYKIEAKKRMATNAEILHKSRNPAEDGCPRLKTRMACLTRHPAPETVEVPRKTLLKAPSAQTKQSLSEVTDCGPKGSR